jgi:DMSO/TMAO reductase YedYZ molybdopterin-dependent catalytic subunit
MAKLLWELWRQRRQARSRPDPSVAARVPPGQVVTAKWPVLTYGEIPPFDPRRWTFRCIGLVERETVWTWEEFLRLPRVTVSSDIHCVTRWSRLDNTWEGVHVRTIIEACRPLPQARFVLQHADPDYRTNTPIEDLVDADVVLALRHNGRDLMPAHGGPMRLVLPKLYFWKSSKWLRAFEFLDVNPPGFWERNGYHMRGDPWAEERYSDGETRAMPQLRAAETRRLRDKGVHRP